ncbi:MAG: Rieske 2Fe-2S domain-containing protein [Rhodospirillaceae bacterium]|nr:Rieske 2Fe-2S domain-containing protein [Rhodospirillaceae bacterium]MBT4590353.1 Rieske 2Fe-2S domain-containing protein [Rhodospirillaceae bacterium]MBT7266555.1 Rieske 2Fe-2S domain-containing protein [Rhodospirillaceae bacterium]
MEQVHGKDRWADYVASGPDTIGGKYLRQFWQPVGLSSEIANGQALPVQVMDEEFTLFRGETGTAHVVGHRCSHRSAQLSTGWVKGDTLQCMYHGWKFDGNGCCVERPGEKNTGAFPQADIPGYPVQEFLGLIYAYFGDGEPPHFPPFKKYEDIGVIENHATIFPCNWFQTMENHFDETHIAFVHTFGDSHDKLGRRYELPEMNFYETDYGMIRESKVSGGKTRKVHYVLPNIMRIMIPTFNDLMEVGGWRDTNIILVPMDDKNHRVYFTMNVHIDEKDMDAYHAMYERFNEKVKKYPPIHELTHEILAGKGHINDYLDHPHLLLLEDGLAQAGQEQIVDRSQELLGRTDIGIAAMRKVFEREMLAVASGEPTTSWSPMTVEPELGF